MYVLRAFLNLHKIVSKNEWLMYIPKALRHILTQREREERERERERVKFNYLL